MGLGRLLLYIGVGALCLAGVTALPARANIPSSPKTSREQSLVERLSRIRARVTDLEEEIVHGARSSHQAKASLRKIRTLLKLQREERALGKRRMKELESTIGTLEARRAQLGERIVVHERALRSALIEIHRSSEMDSPKGAHLPESERFDQPLRKVLANRVRREVKEIELVKADLDDADQLQSRIEEEREHLTYLFQDLKEKESVLELNRQIQVDLLKRRNEDRIAQLQNYRELKKAEAQVEHLISNFNARIELEKAQETERLASKAMMSGAFASLKGKLSLPVAGRIISSFGRSFDQKTRLYIFKKGIDIAAGKNQPVRAVSAGKVAYVGELPNYGRITIVDHGNHYYSLCGKLGELYKKVGDPVAAGDPIGQTDDAGTPVYFEIRARNVAVNPLQWFSN